MPHRHALYREDGKAFLLVVIPRVVSERSFERGISRIKIAFEHDLRMGGNVEVVQRALHDLGLRAAEKASELILAKRVRYRRNGTYHRAGRRDATAPKRSCGERVSVAKSKRRPGAQASA